MSILLHCGGNVVEKEIVMEVETPEPTDTWFPLPHARVIGEVEKHLAGCGFRLTEQTHALSHEGARYFGVYAIEGRSSEYGWIVGVRNSHDKTFPAGLVAGSRVFVCDNLAFTGEVKISRKHTRFCLRDLPHLTAKAVGLLGDKLRGLEQRVEAYKALPLGDQEAHDLVIRATDCRAIVPMDIPHVLKEWREPSHEAFEPRTGWSLFNAVTECHKRIKDPSTLVSRSTALHGLFDGLAGLN